MTKTDEDVKENLTFKKLPFMCRCDHDKNQLFIDDVYFVQHKCKSDTWFPLCLYSGLRSFFLVSLKLFTRALPDLTPSGLGEVGLGLANESGFINKVAKSQRSYLREILSNGLCGTPVCHIEGSRRTAMSVVYLRGLIFLGSTSLI